MHLSSWPPGKLLPGLTSRNGVMAPKRKQLFNIKSFLAQVRDGKTTVSCQKSHVFFSQGDKAEAVFYIQTGKVKLSVVSKGGKEAIVAILEAKAFFGEACLAGQVLRLETVTALESAVIVRVTKLAMIQLLYDNPAFSAKFLAYLLSRSVRIQADLVEQLFNSAEKRLARLLLLMAHFGKEDQPKSLIPKITQEGLAEMVGTTRPRISFFLKKFRKLGFINYNKGMHVHSSLLNVVLHD